MSIFGVVLSGPERGFETNSGGHVERQWTSSLEVDFAHPFAPNVTHFPWLWFDSMTPGSREGIGVDGRRNPSRKPEGCDEEESGEQASDERSTKGDDGVEILNPSATGLSPGSATVLPASPPNRAGLGPTQQSSAESAPPCQDQHHFLRSSVRPPSKRIRKDSIGSAVNGHGGAKSKGTECVRFWGKVCVCVYRWGLAGGLLSALLYTVCTVCLFVTAAGFVAAHSLRATSRVVGWSDSWLLRSHLQHHPILLEDQSQKQQLRFKIAYYLSKSLSLKALKGHISLESQCVVICVVNFSSCMWEKHVEAVQ